MEVVVLEQGLFLVFSLLEHFPVGAVVSKQLGKKHYPLDAGQDQASLVHYKSYIWGTSRLIVGHSYVQLPELLFQPLFTVCTSKL